MDYIMNGIFTLDIIINFFSAYNTSDFTIVDNPKVSINSFSDFSLAYCVQVPYELVLVGFNLCDPVGRVI